MIVVNYLLLVFHSFCLILAYKERRIVKVADYEQDFFEHSGYISASGFVSAAASTVMSAITIGIFSLIELYCSTKLTEFEIPSTLAEYESSFSLKMCVLELCNYFTQIVWILFMKQQEKPQKQTEIGAWIFKVPETCGPGGCVFDVFLQAAGTLLLKQIALLFLIHIIRPQLFFFWMKKKAPLGFGKKLKNAHSWERDFYLIPVDESYLTSAYIALTVQHAFVMFTSVVFPVASLLVFGFNLLAMRLMAKRYLNYYRRPIPYRHQIMDTWCMIMKLINWIAIPFSLIVIFASGDVGVRYIHWWKHKSLDGLVESYLCYQHITSTTSNLTGCYYQNKLNLFSMYGEVFAPENNCTRELQSTNVSDTTTFVPRNSVLKHGSTMDVSDLVLFFAGFAVGFKLIAGLLIKPISNTMDVLIKREQFLARHALMESRAPEAPSAELIETNETINDIKQRIQS